MKIEKISIPGISRTKTITMSSKYVVMATGRRVLLYNHELQLMHTIQPLEYVYNVYISPDETKLLLISSGNWFYILSLDGYDLRKHTIKGKYKGNLEGEGCWSLDGNSFYIPVSNPNNLMSTLRCYKELGTSYDDYLVEKYSIDAVFAIEEEKKYLLVGFDRNKADEIDSLSGCHVLIWYDGKTFEEYYIESYNDTIFNVDYDAKTKSVIIYGHRTTIRCDADGKNVEEINHPEKDLLLKTNKEEGEGISANEFVKWMDEKNVCLDDKINKICTSLNERIISVTTMKGLYVMSRESGEILYKEKIEFGVQNLVNISDNIFAVSTWNGVKFYKILE